MKSTLLWPGVFWLTLFTGGLFAIEKPAKSFNDSMKLMKSVKKAPSSSQLVALLLQKSPIKMCPPLFRMTIGNAVFYKVANNTLCLGQGNETDLYIQHPAGIAFWIFCSDIDYHVVTCLPNGEWDSSPQMCCNGASCHVFGLVCLNNACIFPRPTVSSSSTTTPHYQQSAISKNCPPLESEIEGLLISKAYDEGDSGGWFLPSWEDLTSDHRPNEVYRLMCDNGTATTLSYEIICQPNGTWSPEPVKCCNNCDDDDEQTTTSIAITTRIQIKARMKTKEVRVPTLPANNTSVAPSIIIGRQRRNIIDDLYRITLDSLKDSQVFQIVKQALFDHFVKLFYQTVNETALTQFIETAKAAVVSNHGLDEGGDDRTAMKTSIDTIVKQLESDGAFGSSFGRGGAAAFEINKDITLMQKILQRNNNNRMSASLQKNGGQDAIMMTNDAVRLIGRTLGVNHVLTIIYHATLMTVASMVISAIVISAYQ